MAKNWLTGWTGSASADRVTWDRENTRTALRSIAWVFLLSRLFFFEIASLAFLYLPHAWIQAPQGSLLPSGNGLYNVLAGLWAHWDGLWYLSIAHFGYTGRPQATAFFPLYPLAIKLFGGGVIGGMVVSMASFLAALWFFYRIVQIDLGPRVAWYSILTMAFFPTAFYANAVYSESLFLLLATGSLYFLRTRRYWIAGPLGALATLVSTYGILLVLPFAWMIWRTEGFRIKKLWHALWMPAGLLGYMAFLVPRFGNPLVFEKAQSGWGRHRELFFVTIYQAAVSAWKSAPQAFNLHRLFIGGAPSLDPMNFLNFVFMVFAVVVLVLSVKRIPFYLWVYALAALLIPLDYPAGSPLMSMPRLVLEAFPLFVGVATIMARIRWTRAVYFIVAIPVGMLLTALFATAHWVA